MCVVGELVLCYPHTLKKLSNTHSSLVLLFLTTKAQSLRYNSALCLQSAFASHLSTSHSLSIRFFKKNDRCSFHFTKPASSSNSTSQKALLIRNCLRLGQERNFFIFLSLLWFILWNMYSEVSWLSVMMQETALRSVKLLTTLTSFGWVMILKETRFICSQRMLGNTVLMCALYTSQQKLMWFLS